MTEPRPESIVGQDQECFPPEGPGLPPLRLRAWREHRTLTQQELADRAGVARRTVVGLETGGRRPHPATLRALASALGATPAQLRRLPPA